MLGTFRMDIDTCIETYLEMAPKIFPKEGFLLEAELENSSKEQGESCGSIQGHLRAS
jgi:hypothetical protein